MKFFEEIIIQHHKEVKLSRIALLFSWFTFVIIVISLNLTQKVTNLAYLLTFQI